MQNINVNGLELSTQILIKEALRRNIEVEILDRGDNFIRLTKDSKVEYIKQATKTSADTYVSSLIMENKKVTKMILKERGIQVPADSTFLSIEEAIMQYDQFAGQNIVIKPKSTNFGKGVVIFKPLDSRVDYYNAIEHAFKYDSSIMVEQFLAGKEYRFLVIGDQTAAVLHRVPANVTGDGVHTIELLVKEKNKSPLRGTGYVTPLEKIKLGEIEKGFLQVQGRDLSDIPNKGETVYLRENSNISTGGDSLDFSDEVLEAYKLIAVKATKAVGAKICGADLMIQDIHAEPNPSNYGIIELNFNPALHIHNFPYQGLNRQVEQKVLDLLGFS
ncbi:bifunctional glutamate--cysteine ligase GshA/glutathione synthetase GshB [Cohnella sp.]|uniref:bifunctional glutamate--cysteine ligase GshA/glutathione synthetase GshB n=1 Tax=Cohnella sp. TaxID=1883426 RepID=UPI003562D749